jgi:cytochrome c5
MQNTFVGRVVFGLLGVAVVAAPKLMAQGVEVHGGGVYSKPQAKLGEGIYTEKCVKCHAMSGASMGPPLKGDAFWTEWDGKPARALYSRIISTMPSDDPGSLEEKEVINLVSYLLQLNDLPAGATDIQSPDEWNKIPLQKPK